MEQADRAVTPDDVAAVYRLFLGREPESATVVAEKLSLSLETLVFEIVSSAEFQHVLTRLLGGAGGDPRLDAAPIPGLRAWAAGAFGLGLEDLRRASTWGLLLLEVLASAGRPDGVPGSTLAAIDLAAVHCALNAHRRSAEHASLTGAIEALDDEVVEGWALDTADPDHPLVLQLLVDGVVAAATTPDRFRRDLQDAYGGHGRFGFRLALPPFPSREARSGRPVRVDLVEQASQVRLASQLLVRDPQPRLDALAHVAALLEEIKERLVAVEAQAPQARAMASFSVRSYDAYRRAYGVRAPRELAEQRERSSGWAFQPRFMVVCAGGASTPSAERTRVALQAQSYARWVWEPEGGAAEDGDYLVTLGPGDTLEPDALYRLAAAIREGDRPLLLTVDDDELCEEGFGRPSFGSPRLKGAHDPWLLLQGIEPDALLAVEAAFVRTCGFQPDGLDAPARLRLASMAGPGRVRHLTHVLHHRGRPSETAQSPAPGLIEAVRREVRRSGVRATAAPHQDVLGATLADALRIHPEGPQAALASVIIPTRDRLDLIGPCIEGLLASRSANATPFELLIVDNGGEDPETVRYLDELLRKGDARRLPDASPFNWSRLNNRAAEQAGGEVLVFLNDDTTPVSPTWCDELCLWAMWPGAGVAGARLIYGDGTLQHAGVVTGVFGEAAHEGVGASGRDPGYLGRHALVRRTSAVTGACMAVRRTCFQALGGFDESFAVAYNDVEFCLRAQSRGWAVLYAPQAVFHHFESKTRRFDAQLDEASYRDRRREAARLHAAWGERLSKDPFYNPHFERWAPPFSRLGAPLI